jgi:hypothetical protein
MYSNFWLFPSSQHTILLNLLPGVSPERRVEPHVKPVILRKAKVMSYEDPKEARAKRAKKEVAKVAKGKGKRGRKPKSVAPEAEESTVDKEGRGRKRKKPESEEAQVPEPKAKVARLTEVPMLVGAEVTQTSEIPITPVARMI